MGMVLLTRKQLEKLSMKELRDKLLTVNSIHKELGNLTSSFDDLSKKYARVEYELEVSKKLHETSLQTDTRWKYYQETFRTL